MTVLSLLSDLMLIAAALALATWCWQLSRRLRSQAPEGGQAAGEVSDAVATLRREVGELRAAIAATRRVEDRDNIRLVELNEAADDRIGRMEMLLSSLEDIENGDVGRSAESGAEGDQEVEALRHPEPLPRFRASRGTFGGRA